LRATLSSGGEGRGEEAIKEDGSIVELKNESDLHPLLIRPSGTFSS
jgi:hypothetical protein